MTKHTIASALEKHPAGFFSLLVILLLLASCGAQTDQDVMSVEVLESPAATPIRPAYLVATVDRLTANQINEQARIDLAADPTTGEPYSILDLELQFTAGGFTAQGRKAMLPPVLQPLEVEGVFAIKNENLVIDATLIRVGRFNLTESNRFQLESRVNSSLYRLLPERYVQSFRIENDTLIVNSLRRR